MKYKTSLRFCLFAVLTAVLLVILLIPITAAETPDTVDLSNAVARLTLTSSINDETTETLYTDFHSAFLATYTENSDTISSAVLELLKPIENYQFTFDLRCRKYDLTLDLGGFTHEITKLTYLTYDDGNPGNLIIRSGTLKGTGPTWRNTSNYANDCAVIIFDNSVASLIIEEDASVICTDITLTAPNASGEAVALTYYSNPTVRIRSGTLVNYGQIIGGSMESVALISEARAKIYNHGTVAGGNADAAKHYKYGGDAVRGNVILNTGIIRGGDMTGTAREYLSAKGGTAIDGSIEENRGLILGGSALVSIEKGTAFAGWGVFRGTVGRNSGKISAGTAVNTAASGISIQSMSILYGTVGENTGTVALTFPQTDWTITIDGTTYPADTDTPIELWETQTAFRPKHTLTYEGAEVSADHLTDTLISNGKRVRELVSPGSYTLTLSDEMGNTKSQTIIIKKSNPFTDISRQHPHYADIVGAYQKGLMNGTSPTQFSPDVPLSRAMLVTMLWRMEGCPVVNYLMQFSDVSQEEWYSEAIRWAAAEGLVLGFDDGTFGVNTPITLEQLSVILYRYEQYKGGGFKGLWMFRLNYSDIADISEWAYEAICYMVMKDVYCIPAETELQPQKVAARAEAAVFLNRFAELRTAAES